MNFSKRGKDIALLVLGVVIIASALFFWKFDGITGAAIVTDDLSVPLMLNETLEEKAIPERHPDIIVDSEIGVQANCGGVTDCNCGDTLTSSWTMSSSSTCSGTALNIGAINVVLDCAGYSITHGTGGSNTVYGVHNDGYDNFTIKNCNLTEGNSSGTYKYPIYFENSDNSTIINNNITTIGAFSAAVSMDNSENVNITAQV